MFLSFSSLCCALEAPVEEKLPLIPFCHDVAFFPKQRLGGLSWYFHPLVCISQLWWDRGCAELKAGSQAVSVSAVTSFITPGRNLAVNFSFQATPLLICHAGSRGYFIVIYRLNFPMLETALWNLLLNCLE